jgi:hypothetical protein
MAKKKAKKIGGPFLAAAFFCENILEDMQRKLTVQGISDSVQLVMHPLSPKDMPSVEKPLPFNLQLLLMFRSGDAPGKHKLKLEIESPSGKRTTVKDDEVTLSDQPHGGVNVKTIATMSITSNSGGLYLVDVYLDDKLMTRMPLTITITRAEMLAEAESKKKV